MPEYAIAHDHVLAALTVDKISDALVLLAQGGAVQSGATEAPRIEGILMCQSNYSGFLPMARTFSQVMWRYG